MASRRRRLSLALVGVFLAVASQRATAGDKPHAFKREVQIQGQALELHLLDLSPGTTPNGPLVLYASGDGGWFGTAVEMFDAIGASGFRVVGLSARQFMKLNRRQHRLVTPGQLAEEYHTVLDEARRAFDLPPSTPVILTGWSRGAALAVLAASEQTLGDEVAGVVAIGLPADEQLQVIAPTDDEGDDDPHGKPIAPHAAVFDTYARIAKLTPLRCAVIQATGDKYLAAADARERFGSDSPVRRFFEVVASNHRFSGGRAAFEASLAEALRWVQGREGISRTGS